MEVSGPPSISSDLCASAWHCSCPPCLTSSSIGYSNELNSNGKMHLQSTCSCWARSLQSVYLAALDYLQERWHLLQPEVLTNQLTKVLARWTLKSTILLHITWTAHSMTVVKVVANSRSFSNGMLHVNAENLPCKLMSADSAMQYCII